MIEGVNSAVANATLLKSNTEQAISVAQTPAQPVVQSSDEGVKAPVAPYVSPYIFVNTKFDTAVLQIRDSDTGDVIDQFPRETTLAARQRAESITSNQARVVEVDDLSQVENSSVAASRQRSNVASASLASVEAGPSSSLVASAQVASAALSAGASAGQPTSSGFSITA